jgi:hypothetical protein
MEEDGDRPGSCPPGSEKPGAELCESLVQPWGSHEAHPGGRQTALVADIDEEEHLDQVGEAKFPE